MVRVKVNGMKETVAGIIERVFKFRRDVLDFQIDYLKADRRFVDVIRNMMVEKEIEIPDREVEIPDGYFMLNYVFFYTVQTFSPHAHRAFLYHNRGNSATKLKDIHLDKVWKYTAGRLLFEYRVEENLYDFEFPYNFEVPVEISIRELVLKSVNVPIGVIVSGKELVTGITKSPKEFSFKEAIYSINLDFGEDAYVTDYVRKITGTLSREEIIQREYILFEEDFENLGEYSLFKMHNNIKIVTYDKPSDGYYKLRPGKKPKVFIAKKVKNL